MGLKYPALNKEWCVKLLNQHWHTYEDFVLTLKDVLPNTDFVIEIIKKIVTYSSVDVSVL